MGQMGWKIATCNWEGKLVAKLECRRSV